MENFRELGGLNPDTTFVKVKIANSETDVSTSQLFGNLKIYRALITQSSTGAPTVSVIVNTLGATPTIARVSTGIYSFIFSTATITNSASKLDYRCQITNSTIQYANPFQFNLYSYTSAGVSSDDIFSNTLIEIRSYN